jgi:hypothetical protein
MEELDGDSVTLQVNGVSAARDIVQFVPFKDFQQIENPLNAKSYLAREVLAEIPTQLVGYMKSRNIVPEQLTPR